MDASTQSNIPLLDFDTNPDAPPSPIASDLGASFYLHHTPTNSTRALDHSDTPVQHASTTEEDQGPLATKISTTSVQDDGNVPVQVQQFEDADSSLEKSQQVEAKSLGILRTLSLWALEAVALLVSMAAFLGIIVFCYFIVDRDQPYSGQLGPFRYSGNTFVAICSTILRAMLVFTVTSVIGQSKWKWMKSRRPLRDIEVFDDAGRGAWGSLKFLFFNWKPFPTILGAFVILGSYTVGPASQQAMTGASCFPTDEFGFTEGNPKGQPFSEPTHTPSMRILTAEWVGKAARGIQSFYVQPNTVNSTVWLSPEMRNFIIGSFVDARLFRTGFESRRQTLTHGTVLLECKKKALDCTNPRYESVGVCTKCVDIHDQVIEMPSMNGFGGRAFGLPNTNLSVYQSTKSRVFDMATETTPDASKHALDFYSGTVNTTIITFSTKQCGRRLDDHDESEHSCHHNYKHFPGLPENTGISAANCSLYPCLRWYEANTTYGLYTSEYEKFQQPLRRRLLDTIQIQKQQQNEADYMIISMPCYATDSWQDANNEFGIWYDPFNTRQIPAASMSKLTNWTTEEGISKSVPSECVRGMDWKVFFGIEQFLSVLLNGHCKAYEFDANDSGPPVSIRGEVFDCSNWWIQDLVNNINETSNDIGVEFYGIAGAFYKIERAITHWLRSNGQDWSRKKQSIAYVGGCTSQTWIWLVYPGVLLVLSTGLLVVACFTSCRDRKTQPVWKSSILPLMFYDFVPESERLSKDKRGHLLQQKQLQKMAKKTRAQI